VSHSAESLNNDEDVFHNTAASTKCQGSNTKSRQSAYEAHAFRRSTITDTSKRHYATWTFVYSTSPSVSGTPLVNANLPTRHGKQRFYWSWRRSPTIFHDIWVLWKL